MRCFHWLCFSDWLPHRGCFFSQRFGRLILRPSSGLSRTRELWNFEPNPLLFRGYHVLIPLRPLLLLLLNAVAAAAASIDAVTAIVLPLHSGLNSAPWGTSNFWFNALVASAMCLLEKHNQSLWVSIKCLKIKENNHCFHDIIINKAS